MSSQEFPLVIGHEHQKSKRRSRIEVENRKSFSRLFLFGASVLVNPDFLKDEMRSSHTENVTLFSIYSLRQRFPFLPTQG
jgi:hypothetical protein